MSKVRFEIRPSTKEWGKQDDDRWRRDLVDLQARFERSLPADTFRPDARPGTKGLADYSDVIVSLGSAGAISAAVEVIKLWVGANPGRRSVKVVVRNNDEAAEYEVVADGLGADQMTEVALAALGANDSDSSEDGASP